MTAYSKNYVIHLFFNVFLFNGKGRDRKLWSKVIRSYVYFEDGFRLP